MKTGAKILIFVSCLFITALIFLLSVIPLNLSGCSHADEKDIIPGFEADIYLRTEDSDEYLYNALTDADKVPVLSIGKVYTLTIRKYPQKGPYYQFVPSSEMKLVYDKEKLEITAVDERDYRFIVRGLKECQDTVIEVHHAGYSDTEFIPCSIAVNFS